MIVLALSVAALLALSAVAQAEPPRLILYGSFNPGRSPVGVAVDQSSGDLYVANFFASRISKFDAAGNPLSLPFGQESFYSGAAVNPSNEDVDIIRSVDNEVTETFETRVETYDPSSGALLSSFPVEGSGNFFGIVTMVQIATDSEGNVYVPVIPKDEVLEYSPSGTRLNTFTGSGAGALKEPSGVAVDSSGDVWVADTGNNRVEELSPAGVPIGEVKSEGVESVALDGHGDVLAINRNSADSCGSLKPPCAHLVEYSAAGTRLADIGAGSFEAGEGNRLSPMVTVNEASGRVYVSDAAGEKVWIFGPPAAPVIGRELTAEVGTSEAKLGALVNPGGIQTTYRFEYGTTTAYGQSTPFPEGSVGEGLTPHAVWAAASGLAPGTTYHYRVVATNELKTIFGPDQTFTTLTAEQAACPNEQLRGGFSSRLPDCRAYELVTVPPAKTSVRITGEPLSLTTTAARDGNAISFFTREPLPGAPSAGASYVAVRGAGGWNLEDLIPLESYSGTACPTNQSTDSVHAYSDELSKVIISFGGDSRASSSGVKLKRTECNSEGVQAVSGEPVGYQNLLVRDSATGAYQLINVPPPGVTPSDAFFQGASADASHVVFKEKAALTSNAPYGVEDLYEWDEGALRLLSVLPNGTPALGSLPLVSAVSPKPEAPVDANVISADGSRIFFTAGGALYVRVDGERTIQVDEAQGGSGANGGGSFQAANADGSEVFFLDESKLTADSTAEAGQPDLYECTLPKGASRCELSDLTVVGAGEHANVLEVSMLGSQDSSYVYFVAKGVLASNKREYADSEGNKVIEGATSSQYNLYLWNGKTTTFIATSTEAFGNSSLEGRSSPDGAWFAFDSRKSLTGYDNGSAEEVFLYSAVSNRLVCASCNPSGEAPMGEDPGAHIQDFQRYLSDGGRLFFETSDALVPSDTNDQVDVYEYENEQVQLISGGTSSSASTFIDASESGDDVFFFSRQQLVPLDTGQETKVIYDAHVEGGFPEPVSPPPCTTADACRTPVSPQPSIYGAPSSQTFSGAGNLASSEVAPKVKPKSKPAKCKKGFVMKKGRCVRRPRKKARKSAQANRKTGK